jgi:hypothetical protein
MVPAQADVEIEVGKDGPEVLPGAGTSLHDASGWLRAAEDLERAYDIVARTVINLPPYDELIGD